MNKSAILSLSLTVVALAACAPVGIATGVGATVGAAAVQEGGLSRAASDANIQAKINDLWFRHDVKMFAKLDMTVNQGRVLITGVVQNPQHRVDAVRLAWQPEGVVQVINEIKVADSEGIVGYAKDAWISTRLRTAIMVDKNVQSINYTIDTVQGTVYLMGVAQNQQELNRVIEHARTIENVRQVVSYVKLAGVPVAQEVGTMQQGRPGSASNGWQPTNGNGQAGSGGGYGQLSADEVSAQGGAPVAPVATGEPLDWNNGNPNGGF